ncbi:hypothetical protein HMPREF3199_01936 [Enterococcus faecium]|nr:hypothetical protein HMPREF3199_01936 [Enterococcus faecium]
MTVLFYSIIDSQKNRFSPLPFGVYILHIEAVRICFPLFFYQKIVK